MQPSELWRRGVVVPLSAEAAEQIAAWDVDEATPVEYLPIPDGPLFDELCELGLFTEINAACGSLIDEYEAEWLGPEQLPAAGVVVARLLRRHPGGAASQFLIRLADLMGRAVAARRPVYFKC